MEDFMKKGCLLLLFLAFISCGDKTPFSLPAGGNTSTPPPPGVNAPSEIGLTVNSATTTTLTSGDNVNIVAIVKDNAGVILPNGTKVAFITTSGTISPQATTVDGKATATFTAGAIEGTTTITASSGTIFTTIPITVNRPQTGSILFDSSTPSLIGVIGGGQPITSTVTFLVKDIKGNLVADGLKVDFVMTGPSGGKISTNGGEFIGANGTTTPTLASGSTRSGKASVILNSGAVSGAVTITASTSLGATTLSSSAPAISIGGGIASGPHFNIAASVLNLPGLGFSGITSTITGFIADRFGNFNILKGTSVSFYTEAGAIGPSGLTNTDGLTSVLLRTQAPAPFPASPIALTPKNGHVTVLATVIGEEGFTDANGNGLYEAGEFINDLPEPFIDRNDNGTFDTGEFYIDADGNGLYSFGNNVWDGPACKDPVCLPSKTIWTRNTLAFTGPATCTISATDGSVSTINNAGTRSMLVTIGDINNNTPIAGTTITLVATKVTLGGPTSITLGDGVGGPFPIFFTLSDADAKADVPAGEPYSVTVKVVHGSLQGTSFSDFACSTFGTVR